MSTSRAHIALLAFLALSALSVTPRARAQDTNAGDTVLELRDGGFVRGRLVSDASAGDDVEVERVDGVRIRYARSEIVGLSAHEPRGLVEVGADRRGLFLELVSGPETPQLATRTTGGFELGESSSTQMVAMPAATRSDRLRLCALPCTLNLTAGVYQFALGTAGIDATPPLRSIALEPGDAVDLRYLDAGAERTAGLVMFATTAATIIAATTFVLGPVYGLDDSLSIGLFASFALAAVVQAVIAIVLLLRDDDAEISVRRGTR
jgi:hypothetical protein